jgi:acyl carrier protein
MPIDLDTTDLTMVRDEIRTYIASSFLTETEAEALRDDSDLFAILDSLEVLRLVVTLEKTYAIKVGDGELAPENFSSIERLVRFIARKREANALAG